MVSIFVGTALGRFTDVKSIGFMGCNSSFKKRNKKKRYPKTLMDFNRFQEESGKNTLQAKKNIQNLIKSGGW